MGRCGQECLWPSDALLPVTEAAQIPSVHYLFGGYISNGWHSMRTGDTGATALITPIPTDYC